MSLLRPSVPPPPHISGNVCLLLQYPSTVLLKRKTGAQDFHQDLICTIAALLKPSGRAVLVQPQRGGTADLFMKRIADRFCDGLSASRLEARLVEKHDAQLWAMHQRYQLAEESVGDESSSEYLPDRHLPLLVEVTMPEFQAGGALLDGEGEHGGLPEPDKGLRCTVIVSATASAETTSGQPRAESRDVKRRTSTEMQLAESSSIPPNASFEPESGRHGMRSGLEAPPAPLELVLPIVMPPGDGVVHNSNCAYDDLAEKLRSKLRLMKERAGIPGVSRVRAPGGQLWLAIEGAPGSSVRRVLAVSVHR